MTTNGPTSAEPMSADEFRRLLAVLGWGQRSLADYLKINPTSPRKYATGQLQAPPNIAGWLRTLGAAVSGGASPATALQRHPYPEGWAATPPPRPPR